MKAPAFTHVRPSEVEEALAALHEHGDEAKVLAGGQSLVPLLNLRLSAPSFLVDLGRLGGLRGATGGVDSVWYGATVTHARIEDMIVPDPTRGLLPTVAEGIGYRAIRNRGTICGSLVHADPSAEWPVVCSALDATVQVRSATRERRIPVRELYVGHFMTTLEADELVTGIEISRMPETTTWGVHKHNRKVGEFAESLAVATITRDDDGRATAASVWLGAAAATPVHVPGFDELIAAGSRPSTDDIHDRVRAALPAPADREARYRTHLHGVSVRRAVTAALDQELDA